MSPWLLIPVWYALASAVSFVVYWRDKVRARNGLWRIRERTLLTIDLLGGWPGGLLAQRRIRHKARDRKFQVQFWFIVLAHAGLWILILWLRLQ